MIILFVLQSANISRYVKKNATKRAPKYVPYHEPAVIGAQKMPPTQIVARETSLYAPSLSAPRMVPKTQEGPLRLQRLSDIYLRPWQ